MRALNPPNRVSDGGRRTGDNSAGIQRGCGTAWGPGCSVLPFLLRHLNFMPAPSQQKGCKRPQQKRRTKPIRAGCAVMVDLRFRRSDQRSPCLHCIIHLVLVGYHGWKGFATRRYIEYSRRRCSDQCGQNESTGFTSGAAAITGRANSLHAFSARQLQRRG